MKLLFDKSLDNAQVDNLKEKVLKKIKHFPNHQFDLLLSSTDNWVTLKSNLAFREPICLITIVQANYDLISLKDFEYTN